MIVLIPQRTLEPSPRGPFGLSALFLFMLFLDLSAFPLGTRATYCVVGGGCVGGAYFGVFRKRRNILLEVGRILIYSKNQLPSGIVPWTYCFQDNSSANYTIVSKIIFNIMITNFFLNVQKESLGHLTMKVLSILCCWGLYSNVLPIPIKCATHTYAPLIWGSAGALPNRPRSGWLEADKL